MLHIINKSPTESYALASCLRVAKADDVIVLIENGVLAAFVQFPFEFFGNGLPVLDAAYHPWSRRPSKSQMEIEQGKSGLAIYALRSDLIARGILDKVLPEVQIIDYEDFVDLAVHHHPTQSWS